MLPALALLLTMNAPAQSLAVPANATPLYTTQGRGVQIYTCAAGAAPGWVLKAPDAKLFDLHTGSQVATHSAGPRWTWKDGSTVTGKPLEKVLSPDASSVPWLLLQADHAGSPAGALAGVAYITRTQTHGGNPPATGCDAGHPGASLSVPYTATYTFYTAGK